MIACLEANPLKDYEVPKAKAGYVRMPTADELRRLLRASEDRWNPRLNPDARFHPAGERRFMSRRNPVVLCLLISSGARSSELLSLTLDDYEPDHAETVDNQRVSAPRILIRKTKNDHPRTVYMTPAWVRSVKAYLRARKAVFGFRDDCPALFVAHDRSQRPTCFADPDAWCTKQFRRYMDYAGLKGFRVHDLRHRAGQDAWEVNPVYAQHKLGHKSMKTTADLYGHATGSWMAKMTQEVDTLEQVHRGKK